MVDISRLAAKAGKSEAELLTEKILDFSQNELNNTDCLALARLLRENPSLWALSLSWNSIGDEGMKELAPAIAKCSSLKALNLNNNNEIGDDGIMTLADVLPAASLTELRLYDCGLTDTAVKYIAEALPTAPLSKLKLGKNKFGDSGIMALAEALPTSSMTELDLSSNGHITEKGWKALAAQIPSMRSLSLLDLRGNGNRVDEGGARMFDEGMKEELALAITTNPSLEIMWPTVGLGDYMQGSGPTCNCM